MPAKERRRSDAGSPAFARAKIQASKNDPETLVVSVHHGKVPLSCSTSPKKESAPYRAKAPSAPPAAIQTEESGSWFVTGNQARQNNVLCEVSVPFYKKSLKADAWAEWVWRERTREASLRTNFCERSAISFADVVLKFLSSPFFPEECVPVVESRSWQT